MAKAGAKNDRLTNSTTDKIVEIDWFDGSPDSPEKWYIAATSQERRKRFGQYFTPRNIADLMAKWVCESTPENILEPSMGTGILLRACLALQPHTQMTGVEIDSTPLLLAEKSIGLSKHIHFINADFFSTKFHSDFDGIIANPPYLRHHDVDYKANIHAEIGRRNSISISPACNLYILFIFEICRLLSHGGRAAVIVPTDWMTSNSAKCLRDYWLRTRFLKKVLYFSESDHHFEGALTTSTVLLIEKSEATFGEVCVEHISSDMSVGRRLSVQWSKLESFQKWASVFCGDMNEHANNLVRLEHLSRTKRGIATGANEFFHLSQSDAAKVKIQEHNLRPCVGVSKDVKGLIFTAREFNKLQMSNSSSMLVTLDGKLSENELEYVMTGELQELPKRYLLARRTPWYKTESRDVAPIWAASFGRDRMRFIWNQTDALNLTTFHCIYPNGLLPAEVGALVCLLNSQPIQKRFTEHLRVLGGGLLKFQPNDLLAIEVPDVRTFAINTIDFLHRKLFDLDEDLRNGKFADNNELDQFVDDLINNGSLKDRSYITGTSEQKTLF